METFSDAVVISFAKTLEMDDYVRFLLLICNDSEPEKELVNVILDQCIKKHDLCASSCVFWLILCGLINDPVQESKLSEFTNVFHDDGTENDMIDNEMFLNLLKRVKNNELDQIHFRNLLKNSVNNTTIGD